MRARLALVGGVAAAIGLAIAGTRRRRESDREAPPADGDGGEWIVHDPLYGRLSPEDGTVVRWYRRAGPSERPVITLRERGRLAGARLIPLG